MPNNKIMTSNKNCVLILLLLTITLMSSCIFFPDEDINYNVPLTHTAKTEYNYVTIQRQSYVKRVVGKGKIIPNRSFPLYFSFGGEYVKNVFVKKNDFVKKGEILLELDNSEMLYEIKKCETRYKIAQLKYEKYKSGLTGDVPGSAAELEKLKLDTEAEKNELDYYVNKNKAMSLIAPIDGCITSSLDIKRGDLIRADEVVFTVSDINDLLVEYNGDGASYLKKGMKVSLEYGGKVYEGEVADGGDKISQNVGMARLRILNMKDRVSIGESIDINVQVFRKDNTIVIPRNAIYYNDKKSYVVVLENGTRVERMVQTGFEFDYDIEIIKGLNEGDKVITE